MRHLKVAALALALSLCPAVSAQSVGSSVVFPSGWAPGQSPCVKQADGTCTPVSATNPLPTAATPPTGTSATQVRGTVAPASADDGTAPVKIGCVYSTLGAIPAATVGFRSDIQCNQYGGPRVQMTGFPATPDASRSSVMLISSTSSTGTGGAALGPLAALGYLWSGATTLPAPGDTNGAYVVGKGGSTIATTQVSVGTTATLIAAARVGRQKIGVTVTTPPPPDTLSGTAGAVPTVYALGTHTHPRVTWSPVATTNASGVFTVSFPAGFFASPPTISLSWESAVNISCQMTLVTATALTGRCNLLAGLLPTGAGVIVHVVALPRNSNP